MNRKKFSLIGEISDFDYHGAWGDYISPRPLRDFLAGVAAGDEVEIEINSPGGLVVNGIEMANAIKNCPAHTVAHVTGVAASMASVIACACDAIEMEEASFLMIHDPWGYVAGNAEDLRKEAGKLDQMKAAIMSFYRGKFKGKTADELAALMAEETWYTGSECLANGLDCTVIASDFKAAASIANYPFAKVPDAAAKFLKRAPELTDEGRAELAAARAAASCVASAPVPNAEAAGAGAPSSPAVAPSVAAAPSLLRASVPPCKTSPASATDWEARYKGASKKINELQVALDAANAERDELSERAASAASRLTEFEDQLKAAGFENLAALTGAVSELKVSLEKRDQDLAEAREQLDHLKQTRDLLTGAVLTPAAVSYDAKLSSAKTPEAREELRRQKKAGKIK